MSDLHSNPLTSEARLVPIWLLVIGAAIGLALAASGLLRSSARPATEMPAGVIARVNDATLLTADYERLVSRLEADTRSIADAATRQHILDRMVDEELLVQRGLELGLVARDRRVRGNLSSAVIQSVVIEAEQTEPSPADLEEFYSQQQAFFTQPGRIRVEQIFFRVRTPDEDHIAAARAAEARKRLRAGDDFQAVRSMGDGVISRIPDVLLPESKLREYIGPAALRVAMELEVGEVSDPVRSGVGYHILRAIDREAARTPSFADFEPQIRAEWRRRSGDRALRNYLDELRARARLTLGDVSAAKPPTRTP